MAILKKIGVIIGIIFALLLIVVVGLHLYGGYRLNNAPQVIEKSISIVKDTAAIERGRHLATISSCTGCHIQNLGGQVASDDAMAYLVAPNLTSGAGGIGASYSDADWERALRHGVGPDGRTLILMPSDHFARYGDRDLSDLIAYLKSVPPVDNALSERRINFPATLMFGVLAYGDMPVSKIDHELVGGQAPESGPTAAYGDYLVDITACKGCHAANLAGNYGQLPPGVPLGPNLTPGGDIGDWNLDEFAAALQEGVRPDGRRLSAEETTGMPWPIFANLNPEEVQAIWEYLSHLDPLPDNK